MRRLFVRGHAQRAVESHGGRLGGRRGGPRAMRRRAERSLSVRDPLEVIRGGALLRRRGRITGRTIPAGTEGRAPPPPPPLGGDPPPDLSFGSWSPPLRRRHRSVSCTSWNKSQWSCERPWEPPFASPSASDANDAGKKIGGDLTRGGHPTLTHGLQEPAENLADARGTGGTRHRQQRLRQRAALGAAQTRAKTLHLIRERLEVRVEHLHEW